MLNIIPPEHYLSIPNNLLENLEKILGTTLLGGIKDYPPRSYQEDQEFADVLVLSHKLGTLPVIEYNYEKPNDLCSHIGWGCFEYITKSGIHYVHVNVPYSEHSVLSILVCAQKDVEALKKHILTSNRNWTNKMSNTVVDKPPLLANTMLDEIIQNSINFLDSGPQYSKFKIRLSRGLIFQGLPGNGKTLACKYINHLAIEKGYSVENISQVDIEDAYKDNDMHHLLNKANILFFDDVDLSFLTRSKSKKKTDDSKIACALLSAFDGIHNFSNGIVRIFTTNQEIADIDSAFLRPGRIDKVFTFDKPTKEMRHDFVSNYWDSEILNNIDINILISNTDGCSFAELDEIKSLLVRNFVLNNMWDLNSALKMFKSRL